MVFFRFTVEAGKDVGRQSAVGDGATDGSHSFQVPFAGIFAVHQLKDARAAALYRQVDVFAYIRHFGDDLQRLVTHVFRMRGGETYTHIGYCLGHLAQQLGKCKCGSFFFKAVRIHVLSQQSDLLVPFGRQVAHFIEDAFDVSATFPSACVRHDAIVAEIVASPHDGHESRHVIAADAGGDDIPIGFGDRQFHVDGLLSGFDGGKQVRQAEIGIRSCHEVYVVMFNQVVLHSLGHTADHTHNQLSVFLAAQRMEKIQSVQDFLFGVVADGTRVQQYGIRLLQRGAGRVAGHLQDGGNDFTVGHIHLAAIRFDKEFFRLGVSCGFKVRSRSCCCHISFLQLIKQGQRYRFLC